MININSLNEEEKWNLAKQLSKELKFPVTEMFYGLEVKNPSGIITLQQKGRAHSWTRNWYNWVATQALDMPGPSGTTTFGAGWLTAKNTSGTVAAGATTMPYRLTNTLLSNGWYEQATTGNYGIWIGSGSTAFSIEDYTLATKITSGNASGMMLYFYMSAPLTTYDSTAGAEKWTVSLTRVFNNNSGGDVTVAELGLVWYGSFWTSSYFLMERTVLGSSVTIKNGGQLAVRYTLSMSYNTVD